MDRSFAAGSARGRAGRRPSRARGRGGAGGLAAAPLLRDGLARLRTELSAHRRLRLALSCLVVAPALLGGGWTWFRHSSFVGARQIRVSGAGGPEGPAIVAALTDAAHGMSTLAPNHGALMAAVARFPQVSGVRAVPSFPHGMRIVVLERAPAGALVVSGLRTAVAGDGVVLGPALAASTLPTVAGASVPAVGTHLSNPLVLEAMIVLGDVPRALGGLVARAYVGPRGLTVAMRNGLIVYFGDASRPHAKWLSLVSVLADPGSAGASYVDVRLPGRPAAGFGASALAETRLSGTGPAGGHPAESTISALAAGLKAGTTQPATSGAETRSPSSGETSSGSESGSAPSGTEASEGAVATPGG